MLNVKQDKVGHKGLLFPKFGLKDMKKHRLQNILGMFRAAATENAKVGLSEALTTVFVRCWVARNCRLVTFSGLFPHVGCTAATFLAGWHVDKMLRCMLFNALTNPLLCLPHVPTLAMPALKKINKIALGWGGDSFLCVFISLLTMSNTNHAKLTQEVTTYNWNEDKGIAIGGNDGIENVKFSFLYPVNSLTMCRTGTTVFLKGSFCFLGPLL